MTDPKRMSDVALMRSTARVLERMESENAALRAIIREIHRPCTAARGTDDRWCLYCGQEWPCETERALNTDRTSENE